MTIAPLTLALVVAAAVVPQSAAKSHLPWNGDFDSAQETETTSVSYFVRVSDRGDYEAFLFGRQTVFKARKANMMGRKKSCQLTRLSVHPRYGNHDYDSGAPIWPLLADQQRV